MSEFGIKMSLIAVVGLGLGFGIYNKLQNKDQNVRFVGEAVPSHFSGASRNYGGPFVHFKLTSQNQPQINNEMMSVTESEIYNEAKTKTNIILGKCPVAQVEGNWRTSYDMGSYISDIKVISWKWCE